jgi:hypothetical protein
MNLPRDAGRRLAALAAERERRLLSRRDGSGPS